MPTSGDVTRKAEELLEKFPDPFLAEIAAQPGALLRAAAGLHDQLPALRRVPQVRNGRQLVFTGMGGSYDTCYAPVTALASCGITGVMVDSAELLYFRRPTLAGSTLLVVVSQSGESAEVVRLVEALERLLPMVDDRAEPLRAWLGDRPVLTLLARGAGRAASEMGALTLKEAARFPAEAMQSAQFRHGPLELAGREAAVVLISTEAATREVDRRLAAELVGSGVAVLHICGDGEAVEGTHTIRLGAVDRALIAAPAIVPVQLLAWRLAGDRGLKPGTYTRSSKITTRE